MVLDRECLRRKILNLIEILRYFLIKLFCTAFYFTGKSSSYEACVKIEKITGLQILDKHVHLKHFRHSVVDIA